ncbi:MAG: DUF4886 domain-containing protein [Verrucomicrobiota bacterium]|nr:DUF4886 domain-containing protein [Verrucomicrobiota bacterium]
MKVLTIGNSFSGNATKYMLELLEADGKDDLHIGRADLGGCSLKKHWNLVEQCELLPEVKPYHFHFLGQDFIEMSLKDVLIHADWDFVTLQQVSHHSWQPETYVPYIDRLYELIRELAPQAQPVIHQTWAYRVDSDMFFDEHNLNQAKMYTKLIKTYADTAERLHCPILPCGLAVHKARQDMHFEKDEDYDYENPTPLELPDQNRSLIGGYYWATGNTPSGNAELHMDYRHLNDKGCYIANAVWYEMFTGRKIADNTFSPDCVNSEELAIFQRVAHEATAEYGGLVKG